jgi:hypothetical protein
MSSSPSPSEKESQQYEKMFAQMHPVAVPAYVPEVTDEPKVVFADLTEEELTARLTVAVTEKKVHLATALLHANAWIETPTGETTQSAMINYEPKMVALLRTNLIAHLRDRYDPNGFNVDIWNLFGNTIWAETNVAEGQFPKMIQVVGASGTMVYIVPYEPERVDPNRVVFDPKHVQIFEPSITSTRVKLGLAKGGKPMIRIGQITFHILSDMVKPLKKIIKNIQIEHDIEDENFTIVW